MKTGEKEISWTGLMTIRDYYQTLDIGLSQIMGQKGESELMLNIYYSKIV